ncbi:ABC-2 type transport system permease protein [Deinococcus budaensis]|uniref:Transport permease protein n=1 Tax=Deinococcus budaensis TaxID=1665626 RepID=A0A7W8GGF2_9DEIO|nr:ABC transporter permease [Deinococcus budaensis]MBB5234691.1 ABC-2 type transport system permease protein [Deinococcus budaensis]
MTTTHLPTALPARRPLRAFGSLVWCETLKVARNPALMVPILALPLMLFAFFGWPAVGQRDATGQDVGTALLVGFAAYSMMMVGLFSFGVSVATERGSGWLTRLRVTPLTPLALFSAKVVMALLVGLLALVLLFAFAAGVGVALPPLTWLALLGRLLLGTLPFVVLGLWIGYAFAPGAAAGVANLILLPVAFASGLFVPLDSLPGFLRTLAPYLPAYHSAGFAQGALRGEAGLDHALWLMAYTLAFALLALWAYGRDEGRTYG